MDEAFKYTDEQKIAALNMINKSARGFYWTLAELVVLTGLKGLTLPVRNNKFYLQAQVHKCKFVASAKDAALDYVYFLADADQEKLLPLGGESINQLDYADHNKGRPDIGDVAYSDRDARRAAREVCVCVC